MLFFNKAHTPVDRHIKLSDDVMESRYRVVRDVTRFRMKMLFEKLDGYFLFNGIRQQIFHVLF